jgi:two-component system nitrate/nitrite response regulator NarL
MSGRLRIVIIDRNEIAREGLRRVLSDCGIGSVETCADAGDLPEGSVHLVLVTSASTADAREACRMVREARPQARIVVLADDCCSDLVVDALADGADGVLSRAIAIDPMIAYLHLVVLGEKVIPSSVVDDMPSRSRARRSAMPDPADLSVRELAVLERIAAGRANKLISRDLGIAEGTVKVHVKSILRKLGLANRTQAALWAAGRGAVPAPLLLSVPIMGMVQ